MERLINKYDIPHTIEMAVKLTAIPKIWYIPVYVFHIYKGIPINNINNETLNPLIMRN